MAQKSTGIPRVAPLSPSDYKTFPGPFSLNTKATKKPRLTKGKSTPKPKPSKTNPGY